MADGALHAGTDEKILSVRNLGVKLQGREVLRDIRFDLDENSTLVVLGPNGAGKTVLLRSILGLLSHSGEVHWRKGVRLGYVPQRIALSPELPVTVGDFFALKKTRCPDLAALLSQVGLNEPGIESKALGLLSSGQFQRALIAWAWMDRPDVLIFDEPTAGVDLAGGETIHKLLASVRSERKLSVILVTHDLRRVSREANQVLWVNGGTGRLYLPERALDPEVLQEVYGQPSSKPSRPPEEAPR